MELQNRGNDIERCEPCLAGMVVQDCLYRPLSLEKIPNSLYSFRNSFSLLSVTPRMSPKLLEKLSRTVRGEVGWWSALRQTGVKPHLVSFTAGVDKAASTF